MTEQLHDLLTRIADRAGPGSSDPTLWDRARRARRRDRAVRAASVAALAAALIGGIAIGLVTRDTPSPADRHTPAPPSPGIPSTVHGMHGDGGLDLETGLAVGPASVAIANRSGVFVITTPDGVYHRLRLPGFDPRGFDPEHPGLALSPDGTRLAYSWHPNKPPGSSAPARIATRILDLRTGAARTVPAAPGYAIDRNRVTATYGYDWSPDGQYLVFETVMAGNHQYSGVDAATGSFFLFDAETRPTHCDPIAACRSITAFDSHLFARVLDSGLWFGGFVPLSAADWNVGRIAPDGRRILVQPKGVGAGLLLVTDLSPPSYGGPHSYRTTRFTLDSADWPDGAKIDVLGWIGADHALAMVNRGTAPDTAASVGDLALVNVSSAGDATPEHPLDLNVVGTIEAGDHGSIYSFATDFATVEAPTQDFTKKPSAEQASGTALSTPTSSPAHNESEPLSPIALAAAGPVVLVALSLMLVRRRQPRHSMR